jgi:hypothetical protein
MTQKKMCVCVRDINSVYELLCVCVFFIIIIGIHANAGDSSQHGSRARSTPGMGLTTLLDPKNMNSFAEAAKGVCGILNIGGLKSTYGNISCDEDFPIRNYIPINYWPNLDLLRSQIGPENRLDFYKFFNSSTRLLDICFSYKEEMEMGCFMDFEEGEEAKLIQILPYLGELKFLPILDEVVPNSFSFDFVLFFMFCCFLLVFVCTLYSICILCQVGTMPDKQRGGHKSMMPAHC